jgi:hypothetical protein
MSLGSKVRNPNIAQGMDAEQAYDAVLGAGSFKAMAGELYDELRDKA